MPARRFQPIGGDLSRVDCHLKRGPLTEALAGRGGLARVRKPRQTSLVTTSESKSLSQLPCQPCESTNPIIRAIFKFSYLSIFFFLHLCSFTHSPTRDLLLSFAQRRIRISENAVSRSERDRPIMMTSSRSVLYIYIYIKWSVPHSFQAHNVPVLRARVWGQAGNIRDTLAGACMRDRGTGGMGLARVVGDAARVPRARALPTVHEAARSGRYK